MFGAVKFLLPLGIGIAGLVALASKASASPKLSNGAAPPPLPQGKQKMTRDQAMAKMAQALASADPQVLSQVAAELEKQGYPDQAKDLRGVAAELAKIGAAAAGVKAPPAPSPAVASPVAQMPQAPPASPNVILVPPVQPAPAPVKPLEPMPAPAAAGGSAARENVQRAVIMLSSAKKWKENRDQVTALQMQEKALGHYESLDPMKLGQPGAIDGLYGPGLAYAIAKYYGIAPPNPFYWPKNYAPAVKLYKDKILELAANDPARADEWRQVAAKAKAT